MVAYSKGMPVGTQAPPFSLPGADGKTYSLDSFRDAQLLVVIFTCNHCPYAQALEPRFIELQRDYAAQGVRLVGINPNDDRAYPDDSFAKMQARIGEQALELPVPARREPRRRARLRRRLHPGHLRLRCPAQASLQRPLRRQLARAGEGPAPGPPPGARSAS